MIKLPSQSNFKVRTPKITFSERKYHIFITYFRRYYGKWTYLQLHSCN